MFDLAVKFSDKSASEIVLSELVSVGWNMLRKLTFVSISN